MRLPGQKNLDPIYLKTFGPNKKNSCTPSGYMRSAAVLWQQVFVVFRSRVLLKAMTGCCHFSNFLFVAPLDTSVCLKKKTRRSF